MRRILWIAPLLVAGMAAAQDEVDPARKLLDELTAKFKAAKALDIVVETEQTMDAGTEDEQVMKASSEVHIAKPLYGSFRVKASNEDEEMDLEVLGTGEELVVLNHVEKTLQPGPGAWQAFFSLYLMRVWATDVPPVTRVSLEEAGDTRRLTIAWGGQTEKLVLDKGGRILSAEVVELGDETRVARHTFKRFEASDADPKTYARQVPAGYERFDPMAEMNESLLDVGAAVPAVSVTGMDDKAIKLADLKGKTVLLNFWFFH